MFRNGRTLAPLIGVGLLMGAGAAQAEGDNAQPATDATCQDAGVALSFGAGTSKINDRPRPALDRVANWVVSNDRRTARIEIAAEGRGAGAARKRKLGAQRAQAVKDYLTAHGVADDRISVEAVPAAAGSAGQNRRRMIAIVTCEAPAPAPEVAAAPEPTPPEPAALPAEVTPPPLAASTVEPAAAAANARATEVVSATSAQVPREIPWSVVGVGAAVGGGVTSFLGSGARTFANSGASWEARMTFGMRLPVAFELAYIGSAQGIKPVALEGGGYLLGTGAEADMRFNFTTKRRVQPYLFGGFGWIRYSLRNASADQTAIPGSDDTLEVPFGVGVSVRIRRSLLLDVRGTGRLAYKDTLFDNLAMSTGATSVGLTSWNVGARLGWEF
jgi:hypothetical protein